MSRVRIFNETDELYRAAEERIARLSQLAVARHDRFALLLAGGSTPRRLYALLASPGHSIHIDWANTHLFWGDERAVPPSDPKSNYRMVAETLLSRLSIPWQNIHRIEGELPPAGRVQPAQGEVLWLVDRAAAALLQQRSHSNE